MALYGDDRKLRTRPQNRDMQFTESVSLDSDFTIPHVPTYAANQPSDGYDQQDGDKKVHRPSSVKEDYSNIALLVFLYILQGIPLGLAASMPMILQNKKISYKQQAMFSFVYWPFSLKLLWAPLVDTAYFHKIGRRKSWLVPTQYLIGLFMIFLSTKISSLLEQENPNVLVLTVIFFMLNFLAATQDIAVDGWALTMLKRENVGYASTCNAVGQTTGYFLGNVVFLALESAGFCNKYLRSEPQPDGIVTLPGFLFFWGLLFFVATTLVFMFKYESEENENPDGNLMDTYQLLLLVLKQPAVKNFTVILLTMKIAFAAADSITGLKLVEFGVPKEDLALLAVPMVPVQILLPLVISKYTSGPKPMTVWMRAYPWRLLMGLEFAAIVWWTPMVRESNGGTFPAYYFAVLVISYALHQVTLYSMFVASMAFSAKLSDPLIGGTYMTLLNTLNNLGGNWPSTLALWLVEPMTLKSCRPVPESVPGGGGGVGEQCDTWLDGYYVQTVLLTLFGGWWLWRWQGANVRRLQTLPLAAWRVRRTGQTSR